LADLEALEALRASIRGGTDPALPSTIPGESKLSKGSGISNFLEALGISMPILGIMGLFFLALNSYLFVKIRDSLPELLLARRYNTRSGPKNVNKKRGKSKSR
jgi:hypothetical protein